MALKIAPSLCDHDHPFVAPASVGCLAFLSHIPGQTVQGSRVLRITSLVQIRILHQRDHTMGTIKSSPLASRSRYWIH